MSNQEYLQQLLNQQELTSIQVSTLAIGGTGAAQAVPEPGTLAMLLSIAACGLICWKRFNAELVASPCKIHCGA